MYDAADRLAINGRLALAQIDANEGHESSPKGSNVCSPSARCERRSSLSSILSGRFRARQREPEESGGAWGGAEKSIVTFQKQKSMVYVDPVAKSAPGLWVLRRKMMGRAERERIFL